MFDVAIIGAGFFGLKLATHFTAQRKKIALIERDVPISLKGASYVNQQRNHTGAHYPRSLMTAKSSNSNYDTFMNEFGSCSDTAFMKIYGIMRDESLTTPSEYETFMDTVGIKYVKIPAGPHSALFSSDVLSSYIVRESAFNSYLLRNQLLTQLNNTDTEYIHDEARGIYEEKDGISLTFGEHERIYAKEVYLCTYAHLNTVLQRVGMPLLPIKRELCEVALVEIPDSLRRYGITIMDGKMGCSFMPFPSENCFSLTSVKYTPHFERFDSDGTIEESNAEFEKYLEHPPTHFENMRVLASMYCPEAVHMKHIRSIYTIKAVLATSEKTDERPIVFKRNHGMKGLHCVLAGKLDNIYDILKIIDNDDCDRTSMNVLL